ncbi:hypothetical protein SBBP1_520021 [Burkholderiales bacterium]|nr:hypothetical protein SBBP1_520021 [Burkholderiales bacterium]
MLSAFTGAASGRRAAQTSAVCAGIAIDPIVIDEVTRQRSPASAAKADTAPAEATRTAMSRAIRVRRSMLGLLIRWFELGNRR